MNYKPLSQPEGINSLPQILQRWLRSLPGLIPKTTTYKESLTPSSVAANTVVEESFTVTGLNTEDIVYVNAPSHTANIMIGGARVSAANTLSITFFNNSGGVLSPPVGNYLIKATRR